MKWHLVERNNPNALHGIFDTQARAERHLREVLPEYVARGFFMDKTLRVEDFTIIQKEARV